MILLLLIASFILWIAISFYLLIYHSRLTHDPQEPLVIPPKVPLIGHVIGLLRDGTRYYSRIATECNLPIFTLEIGWSKTYVVTSPSLAAACDRRSKVVSFTPCALDFAKRILLSSEGTMHLLSQDLREERGPVGLRVENMMAMHQSLMPGERLDDASQTVLKHISQLIEATVGNGNEHCISLFQWIREVISIASTDAIYGPDQNPMHNTEVMEGFWAIDRDFALLGLMVLPSLIAMKASRGRQRFFTAFRHYYATGGPDKASQMIKARYEVNRKYKVCDEDIARFDLGVCTALLVNTVPAVFWAMLRIFSHQSLLNELREGISAVVTAANTPHTSSKTATTTVRISEVIKALPLLESAIVEVLRLQSNNSSTRVLLADVLIKDSSGDVYLLKKDSRLTVPSALLHNNESAWGPTAGVFDPRRFVNHHQGHHQRIHTAANRTFGGGNALCPGRHFAINEILGFLIIMILGYDVKVLDGIWEVPKTKHHISTSILTPIKDVWVRIKPRTETKDTRWSFVW
ncbi:cytochrome P450 [Xylaria castorea]|nr:cytochrome P450 [Xylaria castorea]